MTLVIDTVNKTSRRSLSAEREPALYVKREPIHPRMGRGPWRDFKWLVLVALLAIYYVTPWIRWERPEGLPQQAALVDFEHGRFWFFGLHFWAQEVYFITGLLVMAALGLFLANSLFGRIWCGFACPQTIWTDLYIAVERVFEGDRNARLRLAKAPWGPLKILRKTVKHAAWLLLAVATGGAWIFYFHDAPTLWSQLFNGSAPVTAYVSVAVLTVTTYYFAGHMREQVCTYMCPWPRIQGAMLDSHSLQVTYRYDRGEPRGSHRKGESWEGRGDCVDCRQCVVVCPMGIDIRDGAQLECINCALCVDACDDIMAKVDRPKGLIAFDSDEAVKARAAGGRARYHPVRVRTGFYAIALAIVSGLMAWGLLDRPVAHLDVLRDRNPIAVRLKDGSVRNGYTLKLANRTLEPGAYRIRFEGPSGAEQRVVGLAAHGPFAVTVGPDQVRTLRVFVSAPAASVPAQPAPARFVVETAQGALLLNAATVFHPAPGSLR